MANKIPEDVLRDARVEAARQIANRDLRSGLIAMFNVLLRARALLDSVAVDARLITPGPPGRYTVRIVDEALHDEAKRLSKELQRIHLEIETYSAYVIVSPANGEAFDRLGKKCAPNGEDFDKALRRVLLERGASAYQIRETLCGGDDSKRTAADRAKRARLEQLSAVHAATERLVKHHLPTSSRAGWEQYGAELETKIVNLSADRKTTPSRSATPKKRKSSSRKRR